MSAPPPGSRLHTRNFSNKIPHRINPADELKMVRSRGGHSPEKVVRVCPSVKTPFSRFSHRSLDLQLQFDLVLKTPTLSKNNKFWLLREKFVKNLKNFGEFSVLQPKFGPNFHFISPQNVKNFQFLRPCFHQIISSLDPQFGAPHRTSLPGTSLPPKKLRAPGVQSIFGPGGTDVERGMGMYVQPWRPPFSRLSRSSQRSYFKQKSLRVSSQDPLLRKFWILSLYSLNFCPNFNSQAPPPIWQFQFSFRCKNQFASPTLRKSGPHTPTWKKKINK